MVGVLTVIALVACGSRRVPTVAVGTVMAALLAAPSVWAFDTLGHATSGTFLAGGPISAETVDFGGVSDHRGPHERGRHWRLLRQGERPSVSWLAQEVREGKIRWVLAEQSGGFSGKTPGETRVGSKLAMAAAATACHAVTLSTSASTSAAILGAASATGRATAAGSGTLYDCEGDAAALGTQQSHS